MPPRADEASATWIGIDGVTNRSLIQTGTAQDSSSTGASYFAWAEVLPYAPVELGPVSPGDEMRASIVDDSSGTWTITIADETTATRRQAARSATTGPEPPPSGSKRLRPRPVRARS